MRHLAEVFISIVLIHVLQARQKNDELVRLAQERKRELEQSKRGTQEDDHEVGLDVEINTLVAVSNVFYYVLLVCCSVNVSDLVKFANLRNCGNTFLVKKTLLFLM